MKLSQLADALDACLENGSPDTEINGIAGIEAAGPGDLTFVANPKYSALAKTTNASAVIVGLDFPAIGSAMLRSKNPYLAFAQAIKLFYEAPKYDPGIHATAVIHRSAKIGDNFFAHAHAVVRESCRLGDNVTLQNGAVIGADGFGFAKDDAGRWHKIPQPQPAVLENDVEVQANSCIDRASVGETHISRGVKIDNLVQIGHGSRVGEDSLLAAQVGIAGSTEIGKKVILTGQVGVVGHCTVGDGAIVTPQSGVAGDIPAGAIVSGAPAVDHKLWLKYSALLSKLPEMARALRSKTK